jgi:hypothetical protein
LEGVMDVFDIPIYAQAREDASTRLGSVESPFSL